MFINKLKEIQSVLDKLHSSSVNSGVFLKPSAQCATSWHCIQLTPLWNWRSGEHTSSGACISSVSGTEVCVLC